MLSIRRNTFETNSSSTHSLSVRRDDDRFDKLDRIFHTILYGRDGYVGISDVTEYEELVDLLKLLNEAQQILLDGTEDWD